MEIQVTNEGRAMTAHLRGELDHHAATGLMLDLDRELERILPTELTLDFSGVTFMDSSGIAVVIRCRQRMHLLGGRLRMCGVSPQPRKVFQAARIDRMVEMK